MPKLIIYHGGCIDGFTAAWAAWCRYGDAAEYVEGWYGKPAPDVTGRDVLIVDFSYPRAELLEMKGRAASLRVLDHHKSAQADLEGLGFCLFDMNRSGAGLAWDENHDEPRPELIDYVEDRDLWRFALPNSKLVNAWIGSWSTGDFATWDRVAAELEGNLDACVTAGSALLRSVNRYVLDMSKQARVRTIGGHAVQVVNAPYINTSELVGELAEASPNSFAAAWYQRGDGLYSYSLRSRGDFDVSALAVQFGGGGHKNAAGFSVAERVDLDV